MQPKHVKEAFRLLNKSIIRVEQPDIHLEDDQAEEEEQMDVDQGLCLWGRGVGGKMKLL